MILANYPPRMAETVQRIGGEQLLATEQYIDMVSGRTFRSTLLVAAARAAHRSAPTNARIDALHFIGDGAKFDGEFASGSQTYAGTGTLCYSW